MLKKFNEVINNILDTYNKVQTAFKIGTYIAPEKPFKITDENYVSGAVCISEDSWAGVIKDILSQEELLVKVVGNYSERMVPSFEDDDKLEMKGYSAFRGPATLIKMKLIPGETYFLCPYEDPHDGKWIKVIYDM